MGHPDAGHQWFMLKVPSQELKADICWSCALGNHTYKPHSLSDYGKVIMPCNCEWCFKERRLDEFTQVSYIQ